jgi:hypothetical protein
MTTIPLTVTASVPVVDPPRWALLERRLFELLDRAWREFEQTYCDPDGRLRYDGRMHFRDGVDDFYEPFFNWPILYRLGGSTEILEAAKKHWEGVTRQMTEFGFVRDEFELGYDWFHQGESLNFFYALCAADPQDPRFQERAKRFAGLYLAGSPTGNYDAVTKTIVAPHTGSGGPREGLGDEWRFYRASQTAMERYGLPLDDVPGITRWEDLGTEENALRMAEAMQARLGHGDTAINLAATSLVTNAWLYDREPQFADWVVEYVGAWRERAEANGGLIPDNVGPSGVVGELQNGHWFGGHYGWQWPHGLHSVEPAAMTAALSELIVTGSTRGLDLARVPLDTVIAEGIVSGDVSTKGSLGWGWAQQMQVGDDVPMQLVPYRHGNAGWFDFHPVPLIYPVWLWWLSGDAGDLARLESLEEHAGYDWTEVKPFETKEEQGHEAPWISYLFGRAPHYPEQALALALAQVERRLALMRAEPFGPPDDDIHWWQRLQPVVTEILTQLTTGAPPALYNGGLSLARVLFGDASAGRPGLPEGVAALVSSITEEGVRVELVNTDAFAAHTVIVQAGAFGEDRIDSVGYDELVGDYPGDPRAYNIPQPVVRDVDSAPVGASRLSVVLPPSTRITLRLGITRRAFPARHTTFTGHHSEEKN